LCFRNYLFCIFRKIYFGAQSIQSLMIKLKINYHFFKGVFFPILFFISFSTQAQLTVNNTLTPAQLVQTVLLGSGVTASNITYNGAPVAIGKFNGTSSNIGLAGGVIMSTGNIANAVGPNNQSSTTTINGTSGDPDLDQIISPTYSYDAAILEFDFIPTSDTVKFRYVFGSEEYMEWVSPFPGGINDGFGFFISGPGITGTFSNNAKNIALIPGTSLPVTMFNLNLNSHGAYYFDNGNGAGSGTASDGLTVQYDGFTVPLTATTIVQCGKTYHIKLAICDGGDGYLDSGVFLEAGSFASIGSPTAGPDISVDLGGGCIRQATASNYNASSVTWNSIFPGASGTYNNYLSCSSGCLNPTITPPLNGAPTYVDYKVCGLPLTCNPTLSCDTVRVNFNPALSVAITPPIPILCMGQNSLTLTATGNGGVAPYTYLWNNVNPSQSITVGNGTYTVGLKDASGCPPVYSTATVTSFTVSATANAGPDQTVCNQSPTTTLNGSVNAATGGVWSGGAGVFSPNTATLSGVSYTPTAAELVAGFVNLTLTTTGGGSCPAGSDVVRINYVGFAETISSTTTIVSCFGGSDGSATVSIPGTTPPYAYSWNTIPAQATATATNLASGIYSVTIKNGLGCTATNSINVTQPSPIVLASSITNVSCSGGNNGSISITPTGGTPPYTYTWSNGAIISQISNLISQAYTVNVTDAKGCIATSTYSITQPSPILISLTPTDVNCFNGSDGMVSSSVSGGVSLYMYNWSSGTSSPNASGLQAGVYTLTVTDANQCIATNAVIINQPAAALLTTITSTNETCHSSNNGTATANVSGGTSGFSYLWQPGALTSNSISGLSSGTYSLTVIDFKGCQSTAFASITEPNPLTVSFISEINISCLGGNNGSVTANPSGGTPNYSYSWSNGAITPQISNLPSQTYTVTITDNSGCSAINSVTLSQPSTALSVSLSSTSASCYAATDGSASSLASGGTVPYSYTWMPGNLTTQNATGLTAGSYTLTLTDSLGCTVSGTVATNQPSQIVLTTTSINADCGVSNGQTSVSATGGTSPYTYQWTPSGGTSPTATGLFSGSYNVTVTDATGCAATQFGNVNENSPSSASILSTTNVSCNGGADGTATAGTIGGVGPFTYLWMPTGGTNPVATGLVAGSYTVTVTNPGGCKSFATTNPSITEPTPIIVAVTKNNVSCFGGNDGMASVVVSGGTPGYTYQWLPGGSTATNIFNLTANTYTLNVTDANNCTQTISVVITEPTQLVTVTSSISNVSCFGGNNGSATVTTNGGTPIYYYSWLPIGGNGPTGTGLKAGIYTLTTTDFNGCIISNSITITEPSQTLSVISNVSPPSCFGVSTGSVGIHPTGGTANYSYQWNPSVSVSDTASGLAAGNYTILVSDINNCQTNVSVNVLQSNAINGNLIIVNPSCGLSNGSISSQVSGGLSPYTYLWSAGGSTNSGITNIGPGAYSLQVTDASNCISTLFANLNNAAAPAVNVSSLNNVSCIGGNDGSATIVVTQGTAPYILNWTPAGGNNLTLSSLTAGTYTVNVTDATGCQTVDSISINEPTAISVSTLSVTDVLCNGGTTGAISLVVSGGTGPIYSYAWAPANINSSTVTNLSAGNYTVTVTDQKGCTNGISAVVNEPTLLVSSVTNVSPICFNGTGSASVTVSGGVLPYTYLWAPSAETVSTAMNLNAGTYTITCTDANGCSISNNTLISQPPQIITTGGPNDTLCLGQSGTLSATAIGGTGNYHYAWQPSAANTLGTLFITPASSTTYTVIAYDQFGCPGTPASTSAIVLTLDNSNIKAYATTPICLGQSSSVYVETFGTAGSLTYQWTNNLGTGTGFYTVTPAQTTTYKVTVSNSCGLSATDSVTVFLNPQPIVKFKSDSNIVCAPGAMLFIDSSLAGDPNDPISSWNWNFGDGTSSSQQNPAHSYNQPGTYLVSLTVNTSDGCTNNNSLTPLTVTGIPSPNAAFSVNATNLELPNDILILNNQSTGANGYKWAFGDGATSSLINPQYLYTMVGVFQIQLIAMAANGCLDTAYTTITTDADVIFPNAFTPNIDMAPGGFYAVGSLDNDVFFPYTSGVVEYKLEIFDRWGEKIFQSSDIKQGWDGYYKGILCQQEVYIWKAYVKLNNGKVFNKNGNVTLLR
jgi:gliding motility-associated-like protein